MAGTSAITGCDIDSADLRLCLSNLASFMERYCPCLYRREQHEHARVYVEGLLSSLHRKTIEPIAAARGLDRRPLQRFVGEGAFNDDALLEELRAHVTEEIGDPNAVFALDPSAFEKKGSDSVGVGRQWNGRLGKVDNCQKGVYLAYSAPLGCTTVGRRLYLPKDWAVDADRRKSCHVPEEVSFKTAGQLSLDLLDEARHMPHKWVCGDDELGRATEFRAALRQREELYVLDVPSTTLVRAPQGNPSKHDPATKFAEPKGCTASVWAKEQKPGAWVRVLVRDGTKGPHYVLAASAEVETRQDEEFGPRERLVVIKTTGARPEVKYMLSNAPKEFPIGTLVGVGATRHSIEESFERAKGEAGFHHYEVRSWVGWHHHMTLSMLAQWFLTLEQKRMKKKGESTDFPTGGRGDCVDAGAWHRGLDGVDAENGTATQAKRRVTDVRLETSSSFTA